MRGYTGDIFSLLQMPNHPIRLLGARGNQSVRANRLRSDNLLSRAPAPFAAIIAIFEIRPGQFLQLASH